MGSKHFWYIRIVGRSWRWRGESQGKEESEGGAEKGEAEKVRSHF